MTKREKLERLKNRRTKYELAADGKYLAGYCLYGKNNILNMLRHNGQAWATRINEKDMVVFAKNGKSAQLGRFFIAFTGRTQREAICNGELPWFENAISPIKE